MDDDDSRPPNHDSSSRILVRLSDDLIDRLGERARREMRTRNNLIEYLLEYGLSHTTPPTIRRGDKED